MDFNKTVQWREQVGNYVPPSPLASLSDYRGQSGLPQCGCTGGKVGSLE